MTAHGTSTLFRGLNEAEVIKEGERLSILSDETNRKYLEQKKKVEEMKPTDAGYEKEKNLLDKYDKENKKAQLKTAMNMPLLLIGGSSTKNAFTSFIYKNSSIDTFLGHYERTDPVEIYKKLIAGEKPITNMFSAVNYLFELVTTSSHKGAKSFSGRSWLLADLASRLEAAIDNKKDVFDPVFLDTIFGAATADEAYEEGMYMEGNTVNRIWSGVSKVLGKENVIIEAAAKNRTPVSRVPTNQIKTMIKHYIFGWVMVLSKVKKMVIDPRRRAYDNMKLLGVEKNKENIQKFIEQEIDKLDPREAKLYVRYAVRGSLGAIATIAALTGIIGFGGEKHLGYRKDDKKKGEDDLKTMELEVFGKKVILPSHEYLMKLIGHTDQFGQALEISSIIERWRFLERQGKMTKDNFLLSVDRLLSDIESKVPPLSAMGAYSNIAKPILKGGERVIDNISGNRISYEFSMRLNKLQSMQDKKIAKIRKDLKNKMITDTDASILIDDVLKDIK